MPKYCLTVARPWPGLRTDGLVKCRRSGLHALAHVLLAAVAASLCVAQPRARAPLAECAENLELPREGPSGTPGARFGPVVVTVVPDQDGRPASITLTEPFSPASILVKSWVSGSIFATKCAGKEITMQFSFVIEGPAQEYPFSWVTFRGPNQFTIHSRARLPTVLKNGKSHAADKSTHRNVE